MEGKATEQHDGKAKLPAGRMERERWARPRFHATTNAVSAVVGAGDLYEHAPEM